MTSSLRSPGRLIAPALAALALTLPAAAHAQSIPLGFGFIAGCGLSHSEPTPIQFKNNGEISFASINQTTKILLNEDADPETKVTTTVTLRIFNLDGSLDWKAGPFSLTSNEFASSFNLPGFDGVTPAVAPDTSTHLAVFPEFGRECVGVGAVKQGDQSLVLLALGSVASKGTALAPEDLSKLNLLVFNADSGERLFTHRIRPVAGWFLSFLGGPAVLDFTGNGKPNLVVVRSKGLPNNKAQFRYEIYNLLNGNLIRRTVLFQTNNEINQNPQFQVE